MGAAASTNSSKLINKAIVDTMSSNKISATNQSRMDIKINVSGNKDVVIDNLKIKQTATISSKALFDTLNTSKVNNEVDEKISEEAKSLIDGLNLFQAAASTNLISSVVENCVKIKNENMISCSNNVDQRIEVNVMDNNDVYMRNTDISQNANLVFNCISGVENKSTEQLKTDTTIKQLTDTAVHGLEAKYAVMIFGIIALITVSSGKLLLNTFRTILLGPLIGIAGGLVLVSGYNGSVDKDFFKDTRMRKKLKYIENAVPGLVLIKSENLKKDDDIISHGEADLYEVFDNKVNLYSSNNPEQAMEYPDDFDPSKLLIAHEKNTITISIPNSRYKPQKLIVPLNITEIKTTDKINFKPDDTDHAVYVYKGLFKLTGQVKVFQDSYIKDVIFSPAILSVKERFNKTPSNPILVIIGWIGIALGITVTIIQTISNVQTYRRKNKEEVKPN